MREKRGHPSLLTYMIERFRRRAFWRDTGLAYLYLLPALLVLSTFVFYPFFSSFRISFYDWRPTAPLQRYMGLGNYEFIFGDRYFRQSLWQTFYYVVATVPTTLILALVLATLLNRGLRLLPFWRTAYFLPYVTPLVAIALVWQWIYNWRYGLLNYFLSFFGVSLIRWLEDPLWAMPAVIIMNVWRYVGYQAIILLAGMQAIDKEYYDAAKVDGAGGVKLFRHITLPLLSPQIFFVFIISLIGSFKVFTEVNVLFSGTSGPLRGAQTLVYYIYDQGFVRFRMGRAAAAAVVLFGIIFVLTLIQMTVTQRRVHYER